MSAAPSGRPLQPGQYVRRRDDHKSLVGMVMAVLLTPLEVALVRWSSEDTTLEPLDALIDRSSSSGSATARRCRSSGELDPTATASSSRWRRIARLRCRARSSSCLVAVRGHPGASGKSAEATP